MNRKENSKQITPELIAAFAHELQEQERSEGTVENYLRSVIM